MGDLIVMSRSKPLPRRELVASAEILFFTGVRYYRMPDVVVAMPPASMPTGGKIPGKRRGSALERRRRPGTPVAALEALI